MSTPPDVPIPTQVITTAELLAAARYRLAALLMGPQSYGEDGRSVQHAALKDVEALITRLEQKLAVELGGVGVNVVAEFDPIGGGIRRRCFEER